MSYIEQGPQYTGLLILLAPTGTIVTFTRMSWLPRARFKKLIFPLVRIIPFFFELIPYSPVH